MAPDDVVGTWALVSYELHAANGPIPAPSAPIPVATCSTRLKA